MNADVLRQLPAVGILLEDPAVSVLLERHARARVTEALKAELASRRAAILSGSPTEVAPEAIVEAARARLEAFGRPRLRPVVNATGVVINTNLGRSPLPELAFERLREVALGYSNLEYDLSTGKRGSRYKPLEPLLTELTGAEAALVVNNNAAAVLLLVATFATGREVIVSRGQLVEIGGSFRLPDIIAQSGARLVEVGTTNKTHPGDYESAIGPDTGLLLRSHTSNYKIIGFTAEVEPAELARIGREREIVSAEDIGSGVLLDLAALGLPHEPTVRASLEAGLDLVSFSGDKLLGGPQAGIIVGRRELIARLAKHPLTRAFRPDKLTLAALEATLSIYLDPARATREIPTLRMLSSSAEALAKAASELRELLASRSEHHCELSLQPGTSAVGGGSMPGVELPTTLVALKPRELSAQALSDRLRAHDPPVIARISADCVLLDPRTLLPGDHARIAEALEQALG